jgi:hypothetical protein
MLDRIQEASMKPRWWLTAAAIVLCACCAPAQVAQPVADMPVAFDPDFRAKARPVRIVSEQEAQAQKAAVALVRLPNRKLALKARDKAGRLEPFYVRGLGGIGYWNQVRPTAADYEKIFSDFGKLGAHYRNSSDVLGVQFGNEEGFNAYSGGTRDLAKLWENDFNPFTQQFYESWQQAGKSDWPAFKLELVKYYWSHFATAFHEGDPYKLISFNLLSGASESHDPWMVRAEGADSTLYGEGNIDVIGSMLYRRQAMLMWPNLDQHYSYAYQLPILIPSEIGLRAQDVQFQNNLISTLERGAQGLAIWTYERTMVAQA